MRVLFEMLGLPQTDDLHLAREMIQEFMQQSPEMRERVLEYMALAEE